MKQSFAFFLLLLTIVACNSTPEKTQKAPKVYEEIKAGLLVCADSTPIVEDKLNNGTFKVSVYTTYLSNEGQYLVKAQYGGYDMQTETQLPYLNQELRVALRKNEDVPYSYIVGFYMEEDSFKIFHDYLEATSSREDLKFNYLKAYYQK